MPVKRIDYESQLVTTDAKDIQLLIYKDAIWYNQHEPDLLSEMMASELSKIIYPVQVRIDKKGLFVGVTNWDSIVHNRWNKRKQDIIQKYNSDIARSFFTFFEGNLKSKSIFEKSMQYDWFWNLLFHPKYIDYGEELSVDTSLYLPIVPYEFPVEFTGKQKINREITEYNSVEIYFKSEEMKAHPYFVPKKQKSLIDKEGEFYMKLHVYFDLDIHGLCPMHTRAYFNVYFRNSEGNERKIKEIRFTQYQSNTDTNTTTPPEKRSAFFAYEEDEEQVLKNKEAKRKSGFWDLFK